MADFINLIFVLTILLIANKKYSLNTIHMVLILSHLGAIFLFNGVLFEPSYMPDQLNYLEVAQNIRSFDFLYENNIHSGLTVYLPGVFFALFPIPFIDSVYSIGMINFLLFFFLFLFMNKRTVLNSPFISYFYLLYPSLLLYSSLALRDFLIFTLMFISIYIVLLKKSAWMIVLPLYLLIFIKFQNFLIFFVTYILSIFTSRNISPRTLIVSLTLFVIVFNLFSDYFSIDQLNHYRLAFYNENLTTATDQYIMLASYQDIFIKALPSIVYFLFRPLPWIESGVMPLFQFIENCITSAIIVYLLWQQKKYQLYMMQELKFLNLLLLLSLLIYGLVIYNSGTAVRYKFPFIGIYILFSCYFVSHYKSIKKQTLHLTKDKYAPSTTTC